MQQVAQAWLVLELTSDALWLGVVAAAQFVPVMVFGLFGGVLADALPKRQTIFVVQAVMMVLAAILAVLTLTGVVEVWMIIVLALLPRHRQRDRHARPPGFVVEMVGRGDIGNAVALNSAMFNAARVIGPAVAGLTIGRSARRGLRDRRRQLRGRARRARGDADAELHFARRGSPRPRSVPDGR